MWRWCVLAFLTLRAQLAVAVAVAPSARNSVGDEVAVRSWSDSAQSPLNIGLTSSNGIVNGSLLVFTLTPIRFAVTSLVESAVRLGIRRAVAEAAVEPEAEVTASWVVVKSIPDCARISFSAKFSNIVAQRAFFVSIVADQGEAVVRRVAELAPLPFNRRIVLPQEDSLRLPPPLAPTYGSITLRVANPQSFVKDRRAQEAVASAIAEASGVSRDKVGLSLAVEGVGLVVAEFWALSNRVNYRRAFVSVALAGSWRQDVVDSINRRAPAAHKVLSLTHLAALEIGRLADVHSLQVASPKASEFSDDMTVRHSIPLIVPNPTSVAARMVASAELQEASRQAIARAAPGQVSELFVDGLERFLRVTFAVAFRTTAQRQTFKQTMQNDAGKAVATELCKVFATAFKSSCGSPEADWPNSDSDTMLLAW